MKRVPCNGGATAKIPFPAAYRSFAFVGKAKFKGCRALCFTMSFMGYIGLCGLVGVVCLYSNGGVCQVLALDLQVKGRQGGFYAVVAVDGGAACTRPTVWSSRTSSSAFHSKCRG